VGSGRTAATTAGPRPGAGARQRRRRRGRSSSSGCPSESGQRGASAFNGVGEMVCVTRPCGRFVVADLDQESLMIEVPSVPVDLVTGVKGMAARRQLPQRHVRPTHPPPARATVLVEVQVAAFPLVLTDPRGAFGCLDGSPTRSSLAVSSARTTSGSGRIGSPALPMRAASCSSSPTWSVAGGGSERLLLGGQRLRLRQSAGSRFPRPVHRVSWS
jgi:hypothetical protein